MTGQQQSITPPMPAHWLAGAWTPWAWAVGASVWHLAAMMVTLPIVTALPRQAQFALQPPMWGILSVTGVLLLARAMFGKWLALPLWAGVLLVAGLIIAGALDLAMFNWSMDRFGAFDAEYIGPTAALAALTVASAVACFATIVAPRRATWAPAAVAVAAALGGGLVVALNTPGLADGLGVGSVPLALQVAAGGGFTLLAAFVAAVVTIRREVPMG
jgi:hypothetical protein